MVMEVKISTQILSKLAVAELLNRIEISGWRCVKEEFPSFAIGPLIEGLEPCVLCVSFPVYNGNQV